MSDDKHVLLKKPAHPITVKNVLSHTSGLPFRSALEVPTLDRLPLADRVLVSTLKSRELRSVALTGDRQPIQQARVLSGMGRLRDVRSAPDGSIWVLTDSSNGKVLRISRQ